ncbi:MAG TPA: hypothetical protein VK890_02045 [Bacteroidia bacterium]|nr:hypothetical protein [Bacteroidia bacterium]
MKKYLLGLFIFCLTAQCKSQKIDTVQIVHKILMGKWVDTSDTHKIFYFKNDSVYLMRESEIVGHYVYEVYKLYINRNDTVNYKNLRLEIYDNSGEEGGHYFDIRFNPGNEIVLSSTVYGDKSFVLRKLKH